MGHIDQNAQSCLIAIDDDVSECEDDVYEYEDVQ